MAINHHNTLFGQKIKLYFAKLQADLENFYLIGATRHIMYIKKGKGS